MSAIPNTFLATSKSNHLQLTKTLKCLNKARKILRSKIKNNPRKWLPVAKKLCHEYENLRARYMESDQIIEGAWIYCIELRFSNFLEKIEKSMKTDTDKGGLSAKMKTHLTHDEDLRQAEEVKQKQDIAIQRPFDREDYARKMYKRTMENIIKNNRKLILSGAEKGVESVEEMDRELGIKIEIVPETESVKTSMNKKSLKKGPKK